MLKLDNVYKSFGGVTATRNVTLDFAAGSFSAVIGPNGAGKTTLFNLITGRFAPSAGRILLDGKDIAGLGQRQIVRRGIGRAFQVASLFPTLTVAEALAAAVQAHQRSEGIKLQSFPLPRTAARAGEIMEMLKLTRVAGILSRNLSHGDQKLLDVGLALALDPKVLLLDRSAAFTASNMATCRIAMARALGGGGRRFFTAMLSALRFHSEITSARAPAGMTNSITTVRPMARACGIFMVLSS